MKLMLVRLGMLVGEVSMVKIDGFGWLKLIVLMVLKWCRLYL